MGSDLKNLKIDLFIHLYGNSNYSDRGSIGSNTCTCDLLDRKTVCWFLYYIKQIVSRMLPHICSVITEDITMLSEHQ